ncbi:hypothetical protein [Cytobacillus massiliigabonensis]|uniref:hypothetical protein n=1 Tax=Cytobacillus massiliigabonensis TaxID=1871011 RepID=UPI000C8230BB|nr:hypothetical protein [Cytobacillus massiliigabonensis]
MNFSEVIIMLLVFSVLFTYFLVPFQKSSNKTDHPKSQLFRVAFKESFFHLILHKKAVVACILLVVTLYGTWLGYAAGEDHINAHSGYPPISTKVDAYLTMGIVFLYSIFLFLLLVYVKTFRGLKNDQGR